MPKGSASRRRWAGNSRAGLRDTPAHLRQTLEAYLANPALLDGLPPNERALREAQLTGFQATREMRSAASRAGHEVRRQREAARLIDLLSDPDVPDEQFNAHLDSVWASFSDRQRGLVDAWLEQDRLQELSEAK